MFLQLATVERVVRVGSFTSPAVGSDLPTPAFTAMIATLGLVLGVPIWYVQFLPLHGLLLPLMYFVMSREISKSRVVSAAMTLLAVVAVGSGSAFYSTWVHGWGFVLFPLYVWLYFRYLMKPDIRIVGLLTVLLVAVFFYSYTINVWMVALAVLVAIPPLLTRRPLLRRSGLSFALAALAITLGFNRVIYNVYLSSKRFALLDSPSVFLSKYFPWAASKTESPFQYVVSNIWFTLSNVVLVGTLFAVVAVLIIIVIRRIGWRRFAADNRGRIIFALVLSAPADMILYASAGVVSPRYAMFLYPAVIASLLSFQADSRLAEDASASSHDTTARPRTRMSHRNNSRVLVGLALGILLCSAASSLVFRWSDAIPTHSTSYFLEYDSVGGWILNHASNKPFTADLAVGFKVTFDASTLGQSVQYYPINATLYSTVAYNHSGTGSTDYAILSWSAKRVDGEDWEQFREWAAIKTHIFSNPAWNLVYADGSASVLAHN